MRALPEREATMKLIRNILMYLLIGGVVLRTLAQITALAQQSVLPPTVVTKTLMQEPLGDTSEPKMSLFVLNLGEGLTVPAHTHAGAVFAYILQGEIENQLDSEEAQVYSAGGLFHERAMQLHRVFRNLSKTEAAKILIFQNTGSLPASVKPLLQE